MRFPLWIAIDGPSGSGKSSAARGLAHSLGWSYLDTGAMYRAATVGALEADLGSGVALSDIDIRDPLGTVKSRTAAQAVELVVAATEIRSGLDPEAPSISLGNRLIDSEIRGSEATQWVSVVASVPGVRALLVAQQRATAESHADTGIVVEGRDISAIVLPDAPLRLYLTASAAARARRRAHDPAGPQPSASNSEELLRVTEDDLQRRDTLDETRADNPAGIAPGAIVVDSSDMDLEQVVETLLSLYRQIDFPGLEGGHDS